MANLKPPKLGDKLVPVFTDDEIEALLATCKGAASGAAATTRLS